MRRRGKSVKADLLANDYLIIQSDYNVSTI